MKSLLNELALQIPVGSSSEHLICPSCGGGRSAEKSFKIWRNADGISYKCYRVKCSVSGSTGGVAGGLVGQVAAKPKLRPYTGATRPLSDKELDYVWREWGLSDDDVREQGLCTDAANSAVVLRTYTKEYWEWGHQLRRIDGGKPKVKLYWHSEYPQRLHFPKRKGRLEGQFSVLIVVEDIPSAIRASHYLPACALLGTSFSTLQAKHIAESFKEVYLALDKDATEKAIKYKKKYGLMFDKFEVVPLQKDIKNMSHKELDELMTGLGVV